MRVILDMDDLHRPFNGDMKLVEEKLRIMGLNKYNIWFTGFGIKSYLNIYTRNEHKDLDGKATNSYTYFAESAYIFNCDKKEFIKIRMPLFLTKTEEVLYG